VATATRPVSPTTRWRPEAAKSGGKRRAGWPDAPFLAKPGPRVIRSDEATIGVLIWDTARPPLRSDRTGVDEAGGRDAPCLAAPDLCIAEDGGAGPWRERGGGDGAGGWLTRMVGPN
jgi:hypothetical protein